MAGDSVPQLGSSDPVGSLDSFRPAAIKAGRTSDRIGLVIKEAVIQHYGSVKAAALSLNVDPSLMQREFDQGKFGRLEQADEDAKAAIAEALAARFAKPQDPKMVVLRAFTEIERLLSLIRQFVEFAA